jgi:hypothetical protein
MSPSQHDLVTHLALKWISEAEFLASFPFDPKADKTYVPRSLEDALVSKDRDDVEAVMLLGAIFGFSKDSAGVLCKLLLEEWHISHEDIASTLQLLKDPGTVDCLYRGAFLRLPYFDFDKFYSLAVKCIYALWAIGTDEAKEKLSLLSQSDNKVIARNARMRLNALAGIANDKEDEKEPDDDDPDDEEADDE